MTTKKADEEKMKDAEYGLKENPPVPFVADDSPVTTKKKVKGSEVDCCDYFDKVALLNNTDDVLMKILSRRLHERLDIMPEEKLICELECRGVCLDYLKVPEDTRPF